MKYLVTILIIILGFGIYLNRAYAHIYNFIGKENLPIPTTQSSFFIEPHSGRATSTITYVALGDSLTAGVGTTNAQDSYPYQLAQQIANKQQINIRLINLGIPGATTADVIARELPYITTLHPQFITILIGINDMHNQVSIPEFVNNIASIINDITHPHTAVTVITIPYLGNSTLFLPPYQTYFNLQTQRYNAALKSAVQDTDARIIDLYSLTLPEGLTGITYYANDLFHPSAEGYKLWSSRIYDHLNY